MITRLALRARALVGLAASPIAPMSSASLPAGIPSRFEPRGVSSESDPESRPNVSTRSESDDAASDAASATALRLPKALRVFSRAARRRNAACARARAAVYARTARRQSARALESNTTPASSSSTGKGNTPQRVRVARVAHFFHVSSTRLLRRHRNRRVRHLHAQRARARHRGQLHGDRDLRGPGATVKRRDVFKDGHVRIRSGIVLGSLRDFLRIVLVLRRVLRRDVRTSPSARRRPSRVFGNLHQQLMSSRIFGCRRRCRQVAPPRRHAFRARLRRP